MSKCFLSGMVSEPSLPFPTETAKVSRILLLMVSQGCGQFVVGSGQEFFSDVAECADVVAPEESLSFQTFINFQHDKESPVQVFNGLVKMFLPSVVKATALGLRRRIGAFNVFISHCASYSGARVRAAFMREHGRNPLLFTLSICFVSCDKWQLGVYSASCVDVQ